VFVFFVALFPRSLEENLRKTKSLGSKAAQLELDLWVAAASLNLTHVPHKLCLPTHTHTCTHTHTPTHTHTLVDWFTFKHFPNLESGTKKNVSGELKRFFGFYFVYNLGGPQERIGE